MVMITPLVTETLGKWHESAVERDFFFKKVSCLIVPMLGQLIDDAYIINY